MFEHSVVIRVTSFEDVQLTSRRLALYCLLMICKAYEVVANIWVFDPMHCWHAYGGGSSWKWSNGNELWDLVVVRNLFARCDRSSCLVSTAAVGQQFVDREGGVFYVKMVEMFKKVTGAVHVHVFHHQLRAAKDNADGNGFNTSVQPYAMAVHSDSSRLRRHFLGLQGMQWMQDSAKGVSCTSTRGETSPQTPSRTIIRHCATRPTWCHLTITSLRICSCQGPG